MSETLPPLGIRRVKVVALAVTELERANRFYKEKLGLEPAFEGAEQVGWWLGQVILMLKPNWAVPTEMPNPRITLATDHAPATQEALRARDIVIANEVQVYGDFTSAVFSTAKATSSGSARQRRPVRQRGVERKSSSGIPELVDKTFAEFRGRLLHAREPVARSRF